MGQFGRIYGAVIPSQPHLERDRYRDRADGRLEIAHQRRARLAAGDLPRRTAHIDIDDGGAAGLCDTGSLAHPARLAACQLDYVHAQAFPFGPQPCLGSPLGERRARCHFRDDQARSQRGR